MSGDSSISWQGRAFSEILAQQLGAVSSSQVHAFDRALGAHPASAPGISAENTQALAAGATRIGYGEYSVRNGRLEARLTIEDPKTLKMVKIAEAVAPAGDVLGAAGALARQVSSHPAPYGTRNPEALMHFIKAIEGSDGAGVEEQFSQAMSADPDFYPPYHSLAQVKVQRQDLAGGRAVIEQALARPNLPPKERARFELEAAEFSGDAGARAAALGNLAKLDPADGNAWRALAELSMVRHDYPRAVQAYGRASALAPQDPDLLNALGYAAAHTGEVETAMAALRRYQALRPNDVNPLDSMGDVNLACGRLAEAEDFYLQAQKKNRAFLNDADLLKAAVARLLTGDSAAASKLADQYLEARKKANDPFVDYRRAQWSWISGRRKDGLREMEDVAGRAAAAPALREIASRAWADLSLWNLMLGNRDAAASAAQQALASATPATGVNAVITRFLALPNVPAAEWQARAGQQFPVPGQASLKNFALAYALLMNREFGAAQVLLKQAWDTGSPVPDDGLPVMLAWTYLETGKVKEAEELLRSNPIPSAAVLTPYTSFYLPRLFYLRGLMADKAGRRDEARAQYRKFLDVSGPDALAWGEEKKARAAL